MSAIQQNIRQWWFPRRSCDSLLQRQLMVTTTVIYIASLSLGVASIVAAAPMQFQSAGLHTTVRSSTLQSKPDCMNIKDLPIHGLNLTEEELGLLPELCFPKSGPILTLRSIQSPGVPRGVQCNITSWCVSGYVSTLIEIFLH